MKLNDHELVRKILWLNFLAIFAFFVAVVKLATPIEVQESVKLIDQGRNQEALARLNRFMNDGNSANHIALAYRAVVNEKLGSTEKAYEDIYSAASHKWTVGNEGQYRLLPGDISRLRCAEIVDMLRVEERHKSYLLTNLCNDR